jgi:hypothetical protein
MLMKIGTAINEIRPGVYSGPRKPGDGFFCEISSDTGWGKHHAAIIAFITDFRELIKQSVEGGASVTIDIAVEPEDVEARRPIFVLHYEHNLLAALASCGVELEVSIY